jgi:hypothetical protein
MKNGIDRESLAAEDKVEVDTSKKPTHRMRLRNFLMERIIPVSLACRL